MFDNHEVRIQNYKQEHAKLKNAFCGSPKMAQCWYIWKATFANCLSSSPISCVLSGRQGHCVWVFVVGMQSCSAPEARPPFEGGAAERGTFTFPMGQHCLRKPQHDGQRLCGGSQSVMYMCVINKQVQPVQSCATSHRRHNGDRAAS